MFPAFYKINSAADISRVAQRAGFVVEQIETSNSTAQFIVIPPLAVLDLLWLRFLMSAAGKALRPNLIAILQKAA